MSCKKDAYYFAHDTNSKDDPKCVLLIEQLGMEGYGIFWVLIETLRDQPNYKYPIANISAIARRYNTTTEKVRAVIYGYELFVVEAEVFFYSESLNRRMEKYDALKSKRSEAGRLGNNKRWGTSQNNRSATAEQSQVIANKVNESKEKESNIRFTPPSFVEVSEYIIQKGYTTINAQTFIDYYDSIGWMRGRNKIKSWKSAISSWNSREETNRASTLQSSPKPRHYDDL